MPGFKYKAKDSKGKIEEGILLASSKEEAAEELKSQKLSPLSIKATAKPKSQSSLLFSKKVSLIEKANLCRYLSTMINSGLPLSEAIEVLAEDAIGSQMPKILDDLQSSLKSGQPLSTALAKHPDTFDEVFLTLIKTGEESGTLGKSFDYLGKQLYADYELGRKVKATLAYPTVIVLTTLALGLAMLIFVVPKIAPILLRLHETFPLPVYTLIILKTGLFLSQNILLFSLLGLFLGIALFFLLSKPKGKKFLGDLFSRIPFFGPLFTQLALGRFNRTLATLLKSGVPITKALSVSSETLTLPQFKNVRSQFVKEVERGVSFSTALKKMGVFPPIMIRMVSTGEKTGALDRLLLDLAQFYEEEVSNSLKTLTSVIEPIMMLFIGIGVAIIVISVIAPIYSFVGSLSQSLTTH